MSSVTLMSKHLDKVMCFLLLWQVCGLCTGHQVVGIRSDVNRHNLSTDISPKSTTKQTCTKTLHESIEFSNGCRLSSCGYLVAFIINNGTTCCGIICSLGTITVLSVCVCVFFDGNLRSSARKMTCARWLDLSLLFR